MDKSVWKESGALDVDFKDKGGAGVDSLVGGGGYQLDTIQP